MKPKTLTKMLTNLFMTAAILLLMTYALVGEGLHEWLGVGMFALFITHHLLNLSWHKSLMRGSYSASRAVGLALDALIFLCMMGLIWSSVVLSRYVFAPFGFAGNIALARVLHLLCSYWGFVLMSVHLGLHWRMVMGILRGKNGARKSDARAWILRGSALASAAFGLYSFIQNRLLDYSEHTSRPELLLCPLVKIYLTIDLFVSKEGLCKSDMARLQALPDTTPESDYLHYLTNSLFAVSITLSIWYLMRNKALLYCGSVSISFSINGNTYSSVSMK